MKIAYVTDVLYPYVKGGAEKRIWELSTRLAEKGHVVHIYCMKYWGGDDIVKKDGVILHGVCKSTALYTGSGRRRVGEAIYFSAKLFVPLLKGDYDLVDCNQFPFLPLFVTKFCCMLKRKKFFATWHEVWGEYYWRKYLGLAGIFGFLVEKTSVRLPERITSVSEKTKRGVATLGVNENRVTVIPNGIDLAEIRKIRPSDTKSDVIFSGRLIKEKNVDLLIKAVALIPKPVSCIIVGDGPEGKRLRHLADELAISDRITFTGFVDYTKLIALIKSSKVFVLPSSREGFGLSILEASACGIPVISVEHEKNAATELIHKGIPGLACELNESDMAEKIMEVLSNTKRFSTQENTNFIEQYDWSTITEKVESYFYSSCVMNKP